MRIFDFIREADITDHLVVLGALVVIDYIVTRRLDKATFVREVSSTIEAL